MGTGFEWDEKGFHHWEVVLFFRPLVLFRKFFFSLPKKWALMLLSAVFVSRMERLISKQSKKKLISLSTGAIFRTSVWSIFLRRENVSANNLTICGIFVMTVILDAVMMFAIEPRRLWIFLPSMEFFRDDLIWMWIWIGVGDFVVEQRGLTKNVWKFLPTTSKISEIWV